MATKGSTATKSARRKLVLTRVYNAPAAIVFKAWIDARQMAQWWGPRQFTNPVCELDPRPGGAIKIDMRGPDGAVYPCTGTYHGVVEFERLVFTTRANENEKGQAPLEVHNTVTFAEQDGKTTLTLQALVVRADPEMASALAGMEQGWTESLERLDQLLARV